LGFSRKTVEQEEGEDTDPEVRPDFEEWDGEDTLDPEREESREKDDGFLRDNHIMKVCVCVVRCVSMTFKFRFAGPALNSCLPVKNGSISSMASPTSLTLTRSSP
jgi:hypothetical protein